MSGRAATDSETDDSKPEPPPPAAVESDAEAACERGDFARARELARRDLAAASADERARGAAVLARIRPDRAGLIIAGLGVVSFAVLFCYYALAR